MHFPWGYMENVLSCDLPINGQFKSVKKRVMVLISTPVLPLLREILHKCIFKTKCIYFKIRFLKHLILKADGSLRFASSETGYSRFALFTLMRRVRRNRGVLSPPAGGGL